MNITGEGGRTSREVSATGATTHLGIQVPGFPNFLVVGGPDVAAGNFPRATEMQVDFVTEL